MGLNKLQVREVGKFLKKNGIESRLILGDFLDHICCMIEQKMENGCSFEDALERVSEKLPGSEIKTIELFTLNYLHMETSFSVRISLLATLPFGLFGLAWASSNSGLAIPGFIELFLFIGSVFCMFALLGVGWVRDFPRWSFPAIGFSLLFSLFFTRVSVPSFSREVLGFWAWTPLLLTFLIAFLFRPTMEPAKKMLEKVREEPALLLFALYGFVPFFSFLLCDELHSVWMIPVILCSTFILSAGLYFFLRNERKGKRLLSILLSGASAVALMFAFCMMYWKAV